MSKDDDWQRRKLWLGEESNKPSKKQKIVTVNLNDEKINNSYKNFGDKLSISFNKLSLKEGDKLKITVT